MRLVMAAVGAALLLCGCSLGTEYGPMGLMGGVTSAAITDDTFRIEASGNGYTDASTIQDYTLLKAAELTLAANKTYFQIMNGADTTKNSIGQTPGYISTHTFGSAAFSTYTPGYTYDIVQPGEQVIVRVFTPKKGDIIPPNSFPAQEVYDNINPRVKRAS